jgi:class 3 adenylate cyclase
MPNTDISRILRTHNQRHIFRVFRYNAQKTVVPLWMCFSLVDFIYRPDLWLVWFFIRIFSSLVWLVIPWLMAQKVVKRRHFRLTGIVASAIVANSLNIMIAMSGGASSAYIPGVILVTVTCVALFRFEWRHATILNVLCYAPCITVIMASDGVLWSQKIVESSLLVGMMLLSLFFREADNRTEGIWATTRLNLDQELKMMRRTEFLKRHFPANFRKKIENGEINLRQRKMIGTAVVGFADITASTAIANQIDLMTDWHMKEDFLNMATKRATECGLVVLTHTGDGFMFLANYFGDGEWPYSLIAFYEGLQLDFDRLRRNLTDRITGIETGIKCAVAMGPAVVGFIGDDQAYFTVIGPTVNLAARLCAKASSNEIVVGYRVWDVLKHTMVGWVTKEAIYDDLKGFDHSVRAVHILPRMASGKKSTCAVCEAPLSIVRTHDGFIDVLCPNCWPNHNAKVDRPDASQLRAS